MLSITNGDVAAESLRRTGLGGRVLAWRDVLHEGPVPPGLTLREMSSVRAQFLSNRGWGSLHDIQESFQERDEMLEHWREHVRVVLWFEHDLYDQLQLLQLFSWFRKQELGESSLEMICIDRHHEVENFVGLGQLSPKQLEELMPEARPVVSMQLDLGSQAWEAFTSSSPERLVKLLAQDTSVLPFLSQALRRHLEQLPSVHNGLSRTEQQVVEIAARGEVSAGHLFAAQQKLEASPYMADLPFWSYLDDLASGVEPILRQIPAESGEPQDARVVLTEVGHRVLEGKEDRLALSGINRWWGGLHMLGKEVPWRWDDEQERVVQGV
ncbi:MAG: DUF1835 domain-containing protein [Deltaproteobacteria bacterium]|nr:DUF1835 domain-containing protein [Deltaproteobacteria bacterium]